MSRSLPYLNLAGVLLLAALCAAQWRANRSLNLWAAALEETRLEQAEQIADRDRTIRGSATDLDEFRQRLTLAESQLKELGGKPDATTRQRDRLIIQQEQLAAQRDGLKAALDKWVAALAGRDAALKEAGQQVQKLAADRNAAVGRFNDLAAQYNALVKEWNGKQPAGATSRPAEVKP